METHNGRRPTAGGPASDVELSEGQRILRRAVQLEAADTGGAGLDAAALQAAATELGVGAAAMAMALAESRAGVLNPLARRSLGEVLIGPRELVVIRPSEVPAAQLERLVVVWFERGHVLAVTRRADGSVVGRRRDGMAAGAGRMLRRAGGTGGLARVREVRGGVGRAVGTPVVGLPRAGAAPQGGADPRREPATAGRPPSDDERVALCVAADVSDSHLGAVMVGSSLGTVALAGVGLCALALGPAVLLASPVAVVVGVVSARVAHRDTVRRVGESLERTAEAAAGGARPPTPAYGLGRVLRRACRR